MAKKTTTVPQKHSTVTAKKKQKVEWRGYVDYTLKDSDKAMFLEWASGKDVWDNEVPSLVEDGYKVSVSHDSYHSTCIGTIYCPIAGHENAGWCLTARHSDPGTAIYRVVFLHFIVLEGNWNTEDTYSDDNW
jgi:hypothetical protein